MTLWSPGSDRNGIKGGFTMDSSKSFHQKENDLRPSLALQNYWNDKWFYLTHAEANNKSKLSSCKSWTFLHDISWMSFSVVLSQIWSRVLVSISAITPCIVLSALSLAQHRALSGSGPKGWPQKNLTDQILFSLYLEHSWSDLKNSCVYPP